MKTKTYFYIAAPNGLDIENFCNVLNIPFDKIKSNYSEKLGYSFKLGYNENFNVDLNEMVRATLKPLFGKEELLVELKEKYGLEYFLSRVVYFTVNGVNPIISLDNDIIAFMHLTGAVDDLDYYIE